MTRNTKLYRIPGLNEEIVYRTLTLNELTFLDNITNEYYKHENAVRLALVHGSIYDLNFTTINQLGAEIISSSESIFTNDELFKVTVQDFRMRLANNTWINMIITILNVVPGTTFEYLSNLTYVDLVELMCIAERLSNKKLINIQSTPKDVPKSSDHNYLQDSEESKTLQEKIKEDQKWYKEE